MPTTTDTLFSAEDLAICAAWCGSSDPFAVGPLGLRYCAGNADECRDLVAARALMVMADIVAAPTPTADDELARLNAAVVACGADPDEVGGYRDGGRLLIEGRSGADYVPADWTPEWVAAWVGEDAAEDTCAALERSIERSMEARW